ncbi:MAG: LysR family transcriptional regulator [Microbacteriaceae bacterium]
MSDLRGIDVNLLVVLDAILAEKNLTRAGEAVGITQPAVSGSLAKLRRLLDDPLLVRVGRSFELTPRALELRPIVEEAMFEIGRTFNLRPTFDPATSERKFFISASDYVLATMTSPLLSVLRKEAPGASVDFDSLPLDTAITPVDLLRRDVVIAATGRNIPGKRQSLFSDSFACLVSARNPRLRDGMLSLKDLADLRHVQATFGAVNVTPVDDALSAAGVSPKVGMTVVGFMPVPFALQGTSMVGFVPSRVADLYAQRLELVIAETALPPSTLVEAVYWHPSKTTDPALRWLVGVLRRVAELVEFGTED